MLPGPEDSHLFGITFYKQILGGCIRRYFCERDGGEGGGEDAAFGTTIHAWLDAYHSGREVPLLSEDIPPGAYVSPAEFMRRYAQRFSPGGLGQTLLNETRLEMKVPMHRKACALLPWEGIGEAPIPPAFYTEPFVGTLDRIARFDDCDVELLQNERGVMIEQGDYLIDHKSKRARSQVMVPAFMAEPQFTGYHELYRANFPSRPPLKGTLVNIMIRYKEDRDDAFVLLAIPPPDEEAIKVWRHVVREGAAKLREKGEEWVDPTDCFTYNRPCGCLADCVRHNG